MNKIFGTTLSHSISFFLSIFITNHLELSLWFLKLSQAFRYNGLEVSFIILNAEESSNIFFFSMLSKKLSSRLSVNLQDYDKSCEITYFVGGFAFNISCLKITSNCTSNLIN